MPRKPLNNTAVFLETMRIAARTAEGVCTLGCCRNQARKNPPIHQPVVKEAYH